LKKAISDPSRALQMGQVAQEETIRKYSIRRLLEDIESLYAELSP